MKNLIVWSLLVAIFPLSTSAQSNDQTLQEQESANLQQANRPDFDATTLEGMTGDDLYNLLISLEPESMVDISREARRTLTPHQEHELQQLGIIKTIVPIEQGRASAPDMANHDLSGPPPLLVFSVFFVLILAVVVIGFVSSYFKYKERLAQFELIKTAIEREQDLPISFLQKMDSRRNLKSVFLCFALGMGMLLFLLLAPDFAPWSISLIPLTIGVGLLLFEQLMPKAA